MALEYRRDRSSGKVHVAVDGRTFEADNLDDAGSYDVITLDALAGVPDADMCQRCFGPDSAAGEQQEEG